MSSQLFKRMYILYFFTAISLLVLFPISSIAGQQLSKDFLEHFMYSIFLYPDTTINFAYFEI